MDLIIATAPLVRADRDDRTQFARLLNARIAAGWPTEFWDRNAMDYTINQLEANATPTGWGMSYWVLRPPHAPHRTLIGNGGFKTQPGADGVEIGYAIVAEHQRNGYASEASRALIDWAFSDPAVHRVTAETFPHLHASIGVMKRLGMTLLGPGSEPQTIRYSLTRKQHVMATAADARPRWIAKPRS